MEPITTLALVASLFAPVPLTKRPDFFKARAAHISSKDYLSSLSQEFILPKLFEQSAGLIYDVDARAFDYSLSHLLKLEIAGYEKYKDGWNGIGSKAPTSQAMTAACHLIDAIPGGLPLPKPMLSPNGDVGLYWDLPFGYADFSFEHDGSASFFSRDNNGLEKFQEDPIANSAWFWKEIGAIDMNFPMAA